MTANRKCKSDVFHHTNQGLELYGNIQTHTHTRRIHHPLLGNVWLKKVEIYLYIYIYIYIYIDIYIYIIDI